MKHQLQAMAMLCKMLSCLIKSYLLVIQYVKQFQIIIKIRAAWHCYQEMRRYRKQIRSRFFRKRTFEQKQDLNDGHWTDRFLKTYHIHNKLKLLLLSSLLVVLGQQGSGQELRPYAVGEHIPDLQFQQLFNGQITTAKISDYKGKLLILDFWATWCSSCIKKLPELAALQAEFKDQLQILLVTDESEQKVKSFLERRKIAGEANFRLPFAIANQQFTLLFPHQIIPHYAWIDAEGKVYSTTGPEEVNKANVVLAIQKQTFVAKSKVDIDAKRPLFSNSQLPTDGLQYYSLLLKGYYSGLPTGTRYRKIGGINHGIVLSNFPLTHVFYTAARQVYKGLLTKQLVYDAQDEGLKEAHSIEFTIPIQQADSLYPQMLAFLNQFSAYTGSLKNQNSTCLVLKKISAQTNVKSQEASYQNKLLAGKELKLRNTTVAALITRLNDLSDYSLLFIDETGIKEKIDLDLSLSGDLKALNQQLQTYGLQLEETERILPQFKISKTKP